MQNKHPKDRQATERSRMAQNRRGFNRVDTWVRWLNGGLDATEAAVMTLICERHNDLD